MAYFIFNDNRVLKKLMSVRNNYLDMHKNTHMELNSEIKDLKNEVKKLRTELKDLKYETVDKFKRDF